MCCHEIEHTLFVRHFCLNTLKGIIISKWNKLSKDEKDYIHKLVCDYMKEVIGVLFRDRR